MQILRNQPIRRQVVAITGVLFVPFLIAAAWSANRTEVEHGNDLQGQAASVAATAGAYLNTYLIGLDSRSPNRPPGRLRHP